MKKSDFCQRKNRTRTDLSVGDLLGGEVGGIGPGGLGEAEVEDVDEPVPRRPGHVVADLFDLEGLQPEEPAADGLPRALENF